MNFNKSEQWEVYFLYLFPKKKTKGSKPLHYKSLVILRDVSSPSSIAKQILNYEECFCISVPIQVRNV